MPQPSKLERLAHAWELSLRVNNLREATIHRYLQDLSYFVRWPNTPADPTDITPDLIREYALYSQEGRRPSTVRGFLLAISLWCRFLHQEGEIPTNPAKNIKSPRVPVEPQPAYSKQDVERLRAVCSRQSREGVRDRAMILTLYSTGVRLGELRGMGMPDMERMCFTVSGKTGSREIPLGPKLALELDRYLRRWGITSPPLWRALRGGVPMGGNGISQIIRRLCKRSGVKNLGVHAFRRSAIIAMKLASIEQGVSGDSDIMEIVGHKSVVMLKRYCASEATTLAHRAFARLDPAASLTA